MGLLGPSLQLKQRLVHRATRLGACPLPVEQRLGPAKATELTQHGRAATTADRIARARAELAGT
jgi:hypothetical protein